MARQIRTPALDDEFSRAGARTYWKRVLPLATINYKAKDGRTRVIDFNERYLADVKNAFGHGALDDRPSAPFVLADKDNAHTMDPERYRGDVTALVREDELPEDIKAGIIEREGVLPRGLYGRVEFASKQLAKAVVNNLKLPVSMRLREGVERSDGKRFAAVPIHVLGTMDPKIPGLGDWIPVTADLSEYATDDVLDLTSESYTEAAVAKKNGKSGSDVTLGAGTATLEVPTLDDVESEWGEVGEWTEEQLDAFLGKYAPEALGEPNDPADPPEPEPTDPPEPGAAPRETTLSNDNHDADIEFANAQTAEAQRMARTALNRAAAIEWSATRRDLLREGVPPHVLDLAEPVLARANDTVLDLSNFDEDDLNVTEIVRELVSGYKGTVDLSAPSGHGGEADDNPDKNVLDRFTAETAGI